MIDIEIVWSGESHRYELDDGEHRVGRAGENDIQITLARVSKTHALLRVDGERLFVRDLGSSNGTELNGEAVGKEEVEVTSGALVSFAGAMLRRSGTLSSAAHPVFSEGMLTTRLRHNITQGYSSAARDRIVDNSNELFELLASGDDASEVHSAACRFAAKCIDADRVVLLEDEGEATPLDTKSSWRSSGDPDAPLHLSSTIVREVLQGRDSVLVANPLEDPKFGGQQSIMALNLRSAIAAPLFDNQRVRGIFYVDTANPNVQYGQEDLEVLTAIANAVAVKLRNISFEREMRTAAKIQRAMLPHKLNAPEGYELDAHLVMCRSVGGDLYLCEPRADGKVLLVLGDVSGKGTPAALAMGAATVLVGLLAEIENDLLMLAKYLHAQLFRSLAPEQFITMFIGELDPATGVIDYVNAGHEPPLLLRKNGTMEELASTGLPFAMVEELMLETGTVTIAPGDLLAVFSDGIPEATTTAESFMGLDPLKEIIRNQQTDPLRDIRISIVKRVEEFLAGGPASDDVTLLLMRRAG